MNWFSKRSNKQKEYLLWHDWYITLDGKYERIENDKSVQLVNGDGSRIVYGSSFILDGVGSVKDEIQYLETKENNEDGAGYNLSASVTRNSEFLTIAVTYVNKSDKEWAISVVESARRA